MTRPGSGRPWPALALLGLTLLAALVLNLPALRTPFFADDYLFLDQVRHKSLIEALRTPDPLSNFYRPVSRQLYFWIIAGASNESPKAFHVAGLACFVALLVLLFGLARRMAGTYAATFATALVALHYTGDVPVRWACGSQELLSVTLALAALWLHLCGRRWLAALAMVLAALSKEVVLLAPLIAVIADRRPGERWLEPMKRAWPLGLGIGVWAAVWVLAPHTRQAAGTEIELDPWSPVATYVHLVQVIVGAEARRHELGCLPTVAPPFLPLLLTLAAVFLAGAGARWRGLASAGAVPAEGGANGDATRAREYAAGRRHAIVSGVAWALLGTLPVIVVAILWSAYYYLFAMCGVALALGAWLSGRGRMWALVVLAALAWGSNSARQLQAFATPRSPWTGMSHINRLYIDRATRSCERYLEDLKRMEPTLPGRSTLFFAGLKSNIAFQVADGPLMRWAYRDTSLRSYYLSRFTLDKARRGPMYFFVGTGDSLRALDRGEDLYLRIALSLLLSEWPSGTRDALTLEREHHPSNQRGSYWLAWSQWALGDTTAASVSLASAGYAPLREPAPETATATALALRGDIAAARTLMQGAVRRHALDPAAHALLADVDLVANADDPEGPIEAYAARTLAPGDPLSWRRWASVQMQQQRYLEALASFERYFALAGVSGQDDTEAQGWAAQIKRALAGGDVAQAGSREVRRPR